MGIPVTDLAWMAGVLDLRGRVVYKNNKTRNPNHSNQVTLYVESVQLPIVRRLSELTGTNPEFKTPRQRAEGWFRRNCDEHCPEPHVHVNPGDFAESGRWTVSGSAMSVVLTALKPYMIQDKGFSEAAVYGFEYMTLWGRGAAATITALRRLHNLGWEMPPIVEEQRPGVLTELPPDPEPEPESTPELEETPDADAEERGAEEGVPEVPRVQVVPRKRTRKVPGV
jgi:hypothetical protein